MNITEHISTRGLSRADVCAKAGISRAYLSLIERGLRSIGPAKVHDLADALGVSVKDLRPDLAKVFAGSSPSAA
ncbi:MULTISPECIES: helix-turn-helix domain-containing protein [Roseobacteraceae]|uniref:helix-turn-helix domain-containing protein n=1 Tax=Roseobacteraceae TaxID=2854170 RepID=UPI0031D99A26